jgi:hypothetical protein
MEELMGFCDLILGWAETMFLSLTLGGEFSFLAVEPFTCYPSSVF